jgi:hypothetical protein
MFRLEPMRVLARQPSGKHIHFVCEDSGRMNKVTVYVLQAVCLRGIADVPSQSLLNAWKYLYLADIKRENSKRRTKCAALHHLG